MNVVYHASSRKWGYLFKEPNMIWKEVFIFPFSGFCYVKLKSIEVNNLLLFQQYSTHTQVFSKRCTFFFLRGRQKSSLKINRKNSSSPFVVDCVSRKYCYCPYCDEVQKKLPHHCKKKHDDEVLVAKVSSIPPDNHQLIRQEWLQLRNMGNHKHSTLVYQGEADDLVVHKWPSDAHNERNSDYMYMPCGDCLGYFHTDSLWIHWKSCKVWENSSQPSSCSNHVKEGRMLIPLKDHVSSELSDCVHDMAMDKLSLTIRNHKDILKLGHNTLSVSNSSRRKDKAREKMRTIGKVLHHAQEQDRKIETDRNFVHPSSFNVVVNYAKLLSGFDEVKQRHTAYRAPNLVLCCAVSTLSMKL